MQRLLLGILVCFSSTIMAMDRFTMEYYFRDTNIRVVDDEKGTTLVLPSDRLFAKLGDVTFSLKEYPELTEVLKIINEECVARLAITAHTDNVPPQPYQHEISYAQAKQVADYLTAGGIDADRIKQVSGEGDRWPIASNDEAVGRAANRRVEITFLRNYNKPKAIEMPSGVIGIPESFIDEAEREQRKNAAVHKGSK